MATDFICKYCGFRVKWPENYADGSRPINLDGSPHDCKSDVAAAPKAPEPIRGDKLLILDAISVLGDFLKDLVNQAYK
jgi:hypothetical protein